MTPSQKSLVPATETATEESRREPVISESLAEVVREWSRPVPPPQGRANQTSASPATSTRFDLD